MRMPPGDWGLANARTGKGTQGSYVWLCRLCTAQMHSLRGQVGGQSSPSSIHQASYGSKGAHLPLHKYIIYLPTHSCQTLPAQMQHRLQMHRGTSWVSLSVSSTFNTPIPGQHMAL